MFNIYLLIKLIGHACLLRAYPRSRPQMSRPNDARTRIKKVLFSNIYPKSENQKCILLYYPLRSRLCCTREICKRSFSFTVVGCESSLCCLKICRAERKEESKQASGRKRLSKHNSGYAIFHSRKRFFFLITNLSLIALKWNNYNKN